MRRTCKQEQNSLPHFVPSFLLCYVPKTTPPSGTHPSYLMYYSGEPPRVVYGGASLRSGSNASVSSSSSGYSSHGDYGLGGGTVAAKPTVEKDVPAVAAPAASQVLASFASEEEIVLCGGGGKVQKSLRQRVHRASEEACGRSSAGVAAIVAAFRDPNTPVITAKARSMQRGVKVEDGLLQRHEESRARLETQRRGHEMRELQHLRGPAISATSRRLAAGDARSAFDRLYEAAGTTSLSRTASPSPEPIIPAFEEAMEMQKHRSATPSINASSRSLSRSRSHLMEWAAQRDAKIRRKQAEKESLSTVGVRGTPELNPMSVRIAMAREREGLDPRTAEGRLMRLSTPKKREEDTQSESTVRPHARRRRRSASVVSRAPLYEVPAERTVLPPQPLADAETGQPLFTPNVNRRRGSVHRGDVWEHLSHEHERLEAKRERIQEEDRRRRQVSPKLGEKTLKLAKERRRRSGVSLTRGTQHVKSRVTLEHITEHELNNSFTPRLLEESRRMDEDRLQHTGRNSPMSRVAMLHAKQSEYARRRETKRHEQALCADEERQRHQLPTTPPRSPSAMYSDNVTWEKRRQSKLTHIRQTEDNEAVSECTFKPNIHYVQARGQREGEEEEEEGQQMEPGPGGYKEQRVAWMKEVFALRASSHGGGGEPGMEGLDFAPMVMMP